MRIFARYVWAGVGVALAGAAQSAPIAFGLELGGPDRGQVIAKVDTRKMPTNATVRVATFSATVTDLSNRQRRLNFNFLAGGEVLRSGNVYVRRFTHGMPRAGKVESRGLLWGYEADGGKADSGGKIAPVTQIDTGGARVRELRSPSR